MDIGTFNHKTKVINGEVVEEKAGMVVSAPAPNFSKFLIVGLVIGAIFKWYK